MSAKLNCLDCGQVFEAKRSDAKYCEQCKKSRAKRYWHEYEHGKRRGNCIDCGADIGARALRCRTCDNKARSQYYQGEANPNWQKGRSIWNGYIYVRVSHKSGAGAYRPEHCLVWERANGKPLPKGWVVHHLNGVKDDNRIENLVAMPRHEHHSHPRKALKPYEERIKKLEAEVRELQQLRLIESG